MNKRHEEWTERFSDYLAGELAPALRADLETHVEECAACRADLEGLRDVIARAGGLGEKQPDRDLWPGIEAAIGTPVRVTPAEPEGRVIALPTAASSRTVRAAGFSLAGPRLAAAAVVLVALTAVTTWFAGQSAGVHAEAGAEIVTGPTDGVVMVATVAPPQALSVELGELEAALAAARTTLDPNTVRVLERNLAVIETAIADSRDALLLDPGNEFLAGHLERVYERKLAYLRDAARVIEWAG